MISKNNYFSFYFNKNTFNELLVIIIFYKL